MCLHCVQQTELGPLGGSKDEGFGAVRAGHPASCLCGPGQRDSGGSASVKRGLLTFTQQLCRQVPGIKRPTRSQTAERVAVRIVLVPL